ncbi:MAG: FAD-dependent oxidoreductase [Candidatus Caldatribacteriota bacterium]|nr:FAD-dependent oxidoreductase [Atribacterota bacterium]
MKVVIVGGVAGGASAAARLRRLDEKAEIIMVERGPYVSYANCGLPYHLSGLIEKKEDLVVQTPELLGKRFNLDIRTNQEVIEIKRDKKTVVIEDKIKKNIYEENYDKLILSPGAKPFHPPIKGLDSNKVFSLRDIPDVLEIKNFIETKKPERVVLFGAGYIGIEIAENLKKAGVFVTIIELMPQVLGPLDYEMAALVHQHLKNNDVEFYLEDPVQVIEHEGDCQILELASGKKVKTDMIIMGVGVRPETALAKEAGLEIGVTGGIKVNKYLETSDSDIYAVGDAIEVTDFIDNNPTLIPLAGPANKQGRIAANNIFGNREVYNGTQGSSIIKVFKMTIATTGNNEKLLKRKGIEYLKSYTHSPSHAGYYPGAKTISLKLLFTPNGKILGAQAVGKEGVDKRIDVIATAIRAGMKVADLEELELCYAPPYNSAKDPVNMAGYTANNILMGAVEIFHWDEFSKYKPEDTTILDVRKPKECKKGMIPGAINIPLDELRERLDELDKNKNILIYCQVGLRGYLAYRLLKLNGYKSIKNLSGGYKTYYPTTCRQDNCPLYSYEKILKSDILEATSKE